MQYKLKMELIGSEVQIEKDGRIERRQDKKYQVVVDERGVLVEALPDD